MTLRAVPLTRAEANAFIAAHHRHHGRVTSHRFIVGAELDGVLVGCAVIECPNAPALQDSRVAEVTRLCSDGSRNVCSLLYSRASRVARELGFDRLITYTLESEPGTSLLASGWVLECLTRGGTRDRPSRRRTDKAPTCRKKRWAPSWCATVPPFLGTEPRVDPATLSQGCVVHRVDPLTERCGLCGISRATLAAVLGISRVAGQEVAC